MAQPSPEKIRAVLDTELGENDSEEPTVRLYLLKLLRNVWLQQESFNGKRPFGNSCWDTDIITPLVAAGLISGVIDEEGYPDEYDSDEVDDLIVAAIAALDAPR